MIALMNFNAGVNDHGQKNIQITNVRFHVELILNICNSFAWYMHIVQFYIHANFP